MSFKDILKLSEPFTKMAINLVGENMDKKVDGAKLSDDQKAAYVVAYAVLKAGRGLANYDLVKEVDCYAVGGVFPALSAR